MEYMEETRALLKYDLPLNEIIYDFFDALKSRSRGYASFDYDLKGYEQSELVKLDILINREAVDALSFIVHADVYKRQALSFLSYGSAVGDAGSGFSGRRQLPDHGDHL